MIYIVGSGLSAMAAAVALVRRGCRPTILDTGLRPDPSATASKSRLAASEPEDWKTADLEGLRRAGPPAANGIPRKLYFGSDFTFRNVGIASDLDIRQASTYRSFAAGGFSNIWGAVIQPVEQSELRDWPIDARQLLPHYEAVRALLACNKADKTCADITPDQNALHNVHPSTQAEQLKADLDSCDHELALEGIRFQYPRLAVQANDGDGRKGCRYCGMCLYGCPYDCRYAADSTLRNLAETGLVCYRPGVLVDKLSRENGRVRIEGRSLRDGSTEVHVADQVFMAAGLLETSRIVLSSLGLYDTPMEIRHSDIFTLPMLRYSPAAGILRERLHSLCQLVVEIEDGSLCEFPVYLQFYGYSDLVFRMLAQGFGRLSRVFAPAIRNVAARLLVVFGYLHSSVSSSLKLTLCDRGSRMRLEGQPNPGAWLLCRAVAQKLRKNRSRFRAVPLPFALRMDLPGGGYHSGGIFPMRDAPNALQTDRLGRLYPLPGVHLIDASILPAVPAGPLAFTVMANAHRIASECPVTYAR